MDTQPQPDLAQRILVGPTLVVAGIAIYAGLLLLYWLPPRDALHTLAVLLAAQAYGTVAGLFVLLGLRYILGPAGWIEQRIGTSLRHLAAASMGLTCLIVLAVVLIVW